jgi:hypothetical protein
MVRRANAEKDVVKGISTLAVALGAAVLWLPAAAEPADQPAQAGEGPATPAKCLEAAVNPVTGYTFCLNPRGAPVDPPPVSALHPCKPRAHDKEAWTTYEHWSGCGD